MSADNDETVTLNTGSVIDTAVAAVKPKALDPLQPLAVIVPQGATLEIPDLRAWAMRPQRPTGTFRPATVEAFIAFVKRFWSDESAVWVHPTQGRVVGVLDDHDPGSPAWGQHRAELTLLHTDEWKFWERLDGKLVSQVEFAEHIEGGLLEIVEPDSASMLEIAQNFHAKTGVTFRSSKRLHSGEQQLQYDENTEARAGVKGDLQVPTGMLLVMAPFVGEDAVRVAARLRFRVASGQLALGYQLDHPERVVRAVLDAIADRLAEQFDRVYVGQPAEPR